MEETLHDDGLEAYAESMTRFPVPGRAIRRWIVPAREHTAFTMSPGQVLRFVDVEGKQVPDVVFFNRDHLEEHLNLGNSQMMAGRFELRAGDVIVSQVGTPMMTIVGYSNEKSLGYSSMCSEATNRSRYGAAGTRNCRDNLAAALEPWGFDRLTVPDAFKPFMNVKVHPDGTQTIEEPTTEPGDHYDLRAEMDLLVGVSNCPQDRNPCNGWNPTALGIVVYEPG